MAHNLDDFIGEFQGGSRAHRYKISVGTIPGVDGDVKELDQYHVRAMEIPPSQINPIRIPYRGRILKWAGDRLYFPWTIRILDEEGGSNGSIDTLWKALHSWSNNINDHATNVHDTPGGAGVDGIEKWTADWTFQQIDGSDANPETVIKQITLHHCWPTTIGPIALDANSIDQVVEFTVTFEYQWYTVETGGINTNGSVGGQPPADDQD